MTTVQIVLDQGRIDCFDYYSANPILDIYIGSTSLMLNTYDRTKVTADEVRLARELAKAADQYAAALDRRYQEQQHPAQPIPAPRFDPEFDPWAVVHPPAVEPEVDPWAVHPRAVDPDEYTDGDDDADCAMRGEG